MLVKMVAYGVLFAKDAYLKDPWNQLDCLIVVGSVLAVLTEYIPGLSGLRVLRMLRVLRPLRAISRNEGMKMIITSLFRTLPAVSNVFGVMLALQLVFVIIGMQLFSGTMGACSDPMIRTRAECLAYQGGAGYQYADAASPVGRGGGGRVWANPPVGSFDSFSDAMLLLYIMSSGDGWAEPMYMMMDATSAGHAPERNDFSAASFFAVAWMVIGYVFAMNLVVGVVVETFSRMRREEGGEVIMSNAQAQWVRTMHALTRHNVCWLRADRTISHRPPRLSRLRPGIARVPFLNCHMLSRHAGPHHRAFGASVRVSAPLSLINLPSRPFLACLQPQKMIKRPKGTGLRTLLYPIVTSDTFDTVIMSVVLLNVALMACDWFGLEESRDKFQLYEETMLGFGLIYCVECAMKLIALGFDGYFSDSWCRFDFFLVCTFTVDEFASELLARYVPVPPMLLRVLRVFRILRIIRLLRKFKELRNLIVTMILSLPSLFNVAALLALIIFIYAVLGVQLFTFLAPGVSIDDERNFHSVGTAALLLFQCLTGDGWSILMADAMVSEESGGCSVEAGDCGSQVAIPFFISFQLLGSFVFINLVVAVILENFSTLHNTNPNLVSSFDLDAFREAWATFDPDATNYIPSSQLAPLLLLVPRPLGLKGQTESLAVRLCMKLGLPQHMGMVAYNEVILELISNNYFRAGEGRALGGAVFDENEFKSVVEEAGLDLSLPRAAPVPSEERLRALSPTKDKEVIRNAQTVAHAYSFKKIQSAIDRSVIDRWRLRVMKRKMEGYKKRTSTTTIGDLVQLATDGSTPSARAPRTLQLPQRPPPLLETWQPPTSQQSSSSVGRGGRSGASSSSTPSFWRSKRREQQACWSR